MTAKPMHYHGAPERSDWVTPWDFFLPLHREFHFTLDVCATAANAKCGMFISPADDGLSRSWGRNVCWMNPPYGTAIARWMRKAYHESQRGATVVCLVPSRTDTAWWHNTATRGEIRFLRGRIAFLRGDSAALHTTRGGPTPAPFPCALVIFRPPSTPPHPETDA